VSARLLGSSVVLAGCLSACSAGQLPQAPPPPTTSRGVFSSSTTATSSAVNASTSSSTTSTVPETSPETSPVLSATTTIGPPAAANISYNSNAVAAYAVGAQPSNWNIHSAAASGSYLTLEQVLSQVWPSAFFVEPSGVRVLDTSLLDSAAEVSTAPQTVVYQINPRAVWSDGAPITYRDFVYNWQAQSGDRGLLDVGGKPFTPLDDAGYDDISKVTGDPTSPYTVTVVFSKPYAAWRTLFSYLMPAQVARTVGFDTGFTAPVADLVSGGPYMVSELQQGYSLELVRNSAYWGDPANLSSVTYYFTSGATEVLDALYAGEVDVATLQASPSEYQQLQATSGISADALASSFYEDLDFDEASGPLKSPLLRQAIMMAMDRAAMASTVLGPYGLAAKAVDNRALLPGEPGYQSNGHAYELPAPAAALQLLRANGYTEAGGTLVAPNGQPVSLSLFVGSAGPVGAELLAQLEAQVASSCAAIGIAVSVTGAAPPSAGVLAPSTSDISTRAQLPPGWQMALELRQVPVSPSVLASRYASGGTLNVDGYSSAAMNALVAEIGELPASQLPALYDQVDTRAWDDYVDLPLVQVPVVTAIGHGLLNVQPGPYFGNIAWNEQDWGYAAP